MDANKEKLFEFENLFYNDNVVMDFVRVFQISEVALRPGGKIEAHKQACKEISYVVSGEGFFHTGDQVMHVSRGDIHVIAEDVWHEVIASPHERLRFICLGYDFVNVPKELKEMEKFYNTSPDGIIRSEGDTRFLFDMLINEFYAGGEVENCAVESIIKLILIKVLRCFMQNKKGEMQEKLSEHKNMTVHRINKYIDNNIYNVKSVREIANALNFTENYVSHIFKSNMGISLLSYIKKKKLEAAKQLIQNKNMTVTEIAAVLSFDSVQSLSRAFKREYGVTPTQYVGDMDE